MGVGDGPDGRGPDPEIVTIAAALLGWLPEPGDRVFTPVVPA